MKNQTGFRFRLGDEIESRRQMHDVFNALCKKYGSNEIEMPIIVPLDDYVGSFPKPLSKNHLNRIFHGVVFRDESATMGAVRYEGTTPLAKFVSELNFEKETYAFHYFQEMVRIEEFSEIDDRHQRAFFQMGQEKFSVNYKAHLDGLAKTMLVAMEIVDAFTLPPTLRLSHMDLVKKILYNPKITSMARRQLIPVLEKGEMELLENFMKKGGFDKTMRQEIIELAKLRNVPLDVGMDYLKKLGLQNAYEEFLPVATFLKANRPDFLEAVRFDSGIHRSLNFYSGMTMQMDAGSVLEVAGGGDFSALVCGLTGKELFAGGFAAGFERLLLAKKDKKNACAI